MLKPDAMAAAVAVSMAAAVAVAMAAVVVTIWQSKL